MLEFFLNFLLFIICCIIGNLIGSLLANYFISKSFKSSIFSKNDFLDIDDDFFSDTTDSSITDIPTTILNDNISIDDDSKPKFF